MIWIAIAAALAAEPEPAADTAPPSHPPLGEWIALEVQLGRSAPRRSTRDETRITPLIDQMEGARWRRSSVPRCRYELFYRFVPPGAEGGVSALMCNAGGEVYVTFPDEGTFALDGESSYGIWRAMQKLDGVDGPPIAPIAVTENLSTLHFVASFERDKKVNQLELHAEGAEAETKAQRMPITADEAGRLVDALELAGFFQRATRVHRPAVPEPSTPPPEGSVESTPESTAEGVFQLTVTVGDWHRTWWEDAHPSAFNRVTQRILNEKAVPGASRALYDLAAEPEAKTQ